MFVSARLTVARVCVVAVAVFVLLTVVVPSRVSGAAFIFLVAVRAKRLFLASVTYHASLPTPVRGTTVTELAEIVVQKAALVLEVGFTVFE